MKANVKVSLACILMGAATLAQAAQLSTDARAAIPHDVQQLVVIDYQTMQNSPSAVSLRNRVEPPQLKQFDDALKKTALNGNHEMDEYVEELAFALYRNSPSSDDLGTVGIAQGQFPVQDILANFRKQKIKATQVRNESLYPLGKSGMVLCFVDPSTMIFGSKQSVQKSLDARDGLTPNMLSNGTMMSAMQNVDYEPLWSILDGSGTQTMMRGILGEAGSVADFDTVRKRLQGSWYAMDFQHGVAFNLTIATGDSFAAASVSSLMTAAIMLRKMSGSDAEKQALNSTDISSNAGNLTIHFAASDAQFAALLQSPLFSSMVH
ncbi:MAG: hypothetical protein ACLGRW_08845 [Acidobacteriota bacterium]